MLFTVGMSKESFSIFWRAITASVRGTKIFQLSSTTLLHIVTLQIYNRSATLPRYSPFLNITENAISALKSAVKRRLIKQGYPFGVERPRSSCIEWTHSPPASSFYSSQRYRIWTALDNSEKVSQLVRTNPLVIDRPKWLVIGWLSHPITRPGILDFDCSFGYRMHGERYRIFCSVGYTNRPQLG